MTEDNENGWNEWSKVVLRKLDDHSAKLEKVGTEIVKMRERLARLEVKSGIWGIVGGAVVLIVALGISWVKGHL